jgi:hypothetical protein
MLSLNQRRRTLSVGYGLRTSKRRQPRIKRKTEMMEKSQKSKQKMQL